MENWIRYGCDDYTVYQQNANRHRPKPHEPICYSHEDDKGWKYRVQDCTCFGGRLLSRTVRELQRPEGAPVVATTTMRPLPDTWKSDSTAYGPASIHCISDILYQQAFPAGCETSGLIVISGSTKARKSRITRNLIHIYLDKLVRGEKKSRGRPHLVTYEDPIESSLCGVEEMLEEDRAIDYTPREKSVDATDLETVLEQSLRQTPAIVYIGETREPTDWPKLLEFAGSGHLVVTTSHAGSLQECIGGILAAAGAKTAADRSRVALRLVAAIHLRAVPLGPYSVVTPAGWFRRGASVMNFVASGLSSILPNRVDEGGRNGCLGRAWFVEKFGCKDDVQERLLKEALSLDLRGE